jgi:leucyl aminopeptidase
MPSFHASTIASGGRLAFDVVLAPVASPAMRLPKELGPLAPSVIARAERAIALGDFDARPGTRLLLHADAGEPAARVLLVGLGDAGASSPATIRKSISLAARDPLFERMRAVAVAASPLGGAGALAEGVAAAADGFADGTYRWSAATEKRAGSPERCTFVALDARTRAAAAEGIARGGSLAESVSLARDLGNAPANLMSPEELGRRARAAAKALGLGVRILGPQELAREKMEALLAVGEGSARGPRLIVVSWTPPGASRKSPPIALVGKGIVYDTGGVCIKPIESMVEMKYDKCGACVVLGALAAAARLRLPVPVVGVIAAAENLISGTAYRASDVIGSRSGKTIEVLNTDAEGRLVLADAIDYAITEFAPQAIVDLATLTGAAYFALGDHSAALFGTDADLVSRVRAAGERAGERVWELPLWDEYRQDVQTPNADVRNTSAWGAGAIAGATFLQRFVRDVPWAHLDIASVSRDRRLPARGATGFGTRLLVELLRSWPRARAAGRARPAKAAHASRPSRPRPSRRRAARTSRARRR